MPRAVELELRKAVRGGHAPSAHALIASDAIVRTVRLDEDQQVRALRLREDLPVKEGGSSENLGEAEAIILAQDLIAQGISVLVIEEGDGTIAALGRGVNALGCVYVLMLAAVEGLYTDDDAWGIYARLGPLTDAVLCRDRSAACYPRRWWIACSMAYARNDLAAGLREPISLSPSWSSLPPRSGSGYLWHRPSRPADRGEAGGDGGRR